MATKTQVRQAAKYYAKKTLAENFGVCIAVSLIASVISTLAASVGTYFGVPAEELLAADITIESGTISILPQFLMGQGITLLLGFLIAPISIGTYGFFMHLSRQRRMKISDLFIWFGDFSLMKKAIGAMVWYTLITIGWLIVFLAIPMAILFALMMFPLSETMLMTLLFPATILFAAATICAEVKVYGYTPALYILAENPELGVMNAFRSCKEVMRGHVWEFFVLQLSFILWHLLASVTCGLSVLYVTPYITMTNCYFINHVIGDYHKRHNIPTHNGDALDPSELTEEEQAARDTDSDDSIRF